MKITEKQIRHTIQTANLGSLKATTSGLKVHRLDTGYKLEVIARSTGGQLVLLGEGMSASECMACLNGYLSGVDDRVMEPANNRLRLIRRMELLTVDHSPDDYASVQIKDITALIVMAQDMAHIAAKMGLLSAQRLDQLTTLEAKLQLSIKPTIPST